MKTLKYLLILFLLTASLVFGASDDPVGEGHSVQREYYTFDKQGEDGYFGIRKVTVIERDGVIISKLYHRRTIDPNSDLSDETDEVKAAAAAFYTDEIRAKFQSMLDAKIAALEAQ